MVVVPRRLWAGLHLARPHNHTHRQSQSVSPQLQPKRSDPLRRVYAQNALGVIMVRVALPIDRSVARANKGDDSLKVRSATVWPLKRARILGILSPTLVFRLARVGLGGETRNEGVSGKRSTNMHSEVLAIVD